MILRYLRRGQGVELLHQHLAWDYLRISTIPPRFKRPIIPMLSVESACDIFYGIYENDGRTVIMHMIISDVVRQGLGRTTVVDPPDGL